MSFRAKRGVRFSLLCALCVLCVKKTFPYFVTLAMNTEYGSIGIFANIPVTRL